MGFGALIEMVFPHACVGCGVPGTRWCPACSPTGPLVSVAGLGLPVVAVGAYDGVLRTAVLEYKERGRRDLAVPIGQMLVDALAEVARAPDLAASGRPRRRLPVVLVPVPSTRAAARARGGQHVLRLARRAAAGSVAPGLRVEVVDALRVGRAIADSAALTAAERSRNVAGSLACVDHPRGDLRVVLVDDIVTTGATLREAHRALSDGGWNVAGAIVVAATARRFPPPSRVPGDDHAGSGIGAG